MSHRSHNVRRRVDKGKKDLGWGSGGLTPRGMFVEAKEKGEAEERGGEGSTRPVPKEVLAGLNVQIAHVMRTYLMFFRRNTKTF